jgi:hypothetical protein
MKNTIEVIGMDFTGTEERKLRISYYGERNLYHISIWDPSGQLLASVVLPKELLFSALKHFKDGGGSRPGPKR